MGERRRTSRLFCHQHRATVNGNNVGKYGVTWLQFTYFSVFAHCTETCWLCGSCKPTVCGTARENGQATSKLSTIFVTGSGYRLMSATLKKWRNLNVKHEFPVFDSYAETRWLCGSCKLSFMERVKKMGELQSSVQTFCPQAPSAKDNSDNILENMS